jgi:TorA maturation chaperone TorD
VDAGERYRFEMQQNEPEDHLDLLLLAAWLAENGRDAECASFWRGTCCRGAPASCRVCRQRRASVLYRAGKLAQLTLADWRSGLLIPVAEKTLYR